jgi:hypothetical protein
VKRLNKETNDIRVDYKDLHVMCKSSLLLQFNHAKAPQGALEHCLERKTPREFGPDLLTEHRGKPYVVGGRGSAVGVW